MTMRVVELAKTLGLTSKELLALLAKKGIAVENHMSMLKAEQVAAVKLAVASAAGSTRKTSASPKRATTKSPATSTAPAAAVKPKGAAKGAAKSAKSSARDEAVAPEVVSSLPRRTTVLIKRKRPAEEAPVDAMAVSTAPPLEEHHEPVAHAESPASVEVLPSAPVPPVPHPFSPVTSPPSALHAAAPATPAGGVVVPHPGDAGSPHARVPDAQLQAGAKSAPVAATLTPAERESAEQAAKAKRLKVTKEEMFDFRREVKKLHDFKPFQYRGARVAPRKMIKRQHGTDVPDASKPRRKVIKLSPGLTIKEFAEMIGQKAGLIIGRLMEMGVMATINQPIDLDAALLIAEAFELKAEIVFQPTEEELMGVEAPEVSEESLVPRPPVVTIMGHVDHGKTSLLDAIREAKVAASEAGGITQHIGAYTVEVRGKQVTFLDTPGHEAFTAMRARGAKVTDLVVLVVAADDGVMPQTVEAINHAKAAEVPILVAINKMDKPEAQAERVKRELADQGLLSEAWGGTTIFVEVSAKKKTGLETLLEMILLQADVLELRARPSAPARGTIIEAKLDRGRGPVATVLVQDGTLRVGDIFVSGVHAGRIRALINDLGRRVEAAGPATAVEVIGLDGVPQAGDPLLVVPDERAAKEVTTARMHRQRLVELSSYHKITLEELHTRIKDGAVKELNLVIKADVQGSVEALKEALERLSTAAVKIRVIHSGAGGITESDVLLASSSNALIIGFHIRPDAKVQALAEREKVTIRLYEVIYNVTAEIKAAMEGLLEPIIQEKVVGRADVRQLFSVPKVGVIAGTYVTEGTISRSGTGVRVVRDHVTVYEGKIGSLRRFKDDVREVQTGYECGIGVENFNDLKVGDVLEVFVQEKVAAKLEG